MIDDKVKEDVIYALAAKIREASADNTSGLETIDRLGHAIECVLAGLNISDKGYKRTGE